MKTDVIIVSSNGDQMEEALKLADKTAAFKELSPKNALHLRLLTEEMMGLMRSCAEDMEGEFWIEDENDVYKLTLRVNGRLTEAKREKLLSASSSGKNEATRGIMGKIRAFFEPDEEYPAFFIMSLADGTGTAYDDMSWSLEVYRDQVLKSVEENREGAKEAWDELEKSVVSHVADDVKISIRGRDIEMVIYKKMA